MIGTRMGWRDEEGHKDQLIYVLSGKVNLILKTRSQSRFYNNKKFRQQILESQLYLTTNMVVELGQISPTSLTCDETEITVETEDYDSGVSRLTLTNLVHGVFN